MAAATGITAQDDRLLSALRARLPAEVIHADEATRAAFSADLSYIPNPIADVVVAPRTRAELVEAVRAAAEARRAVYVRGGGMSYTSGYTPATEGAMLLDLRGLRAIEIHEHDMYVVAEAGVTWLELNEALEARGLRTPYWGPFSGRFATVGGALSQNSVFHGAAQHRTVAESVVGIEVVLADGSLVRTGSWAQRHSVPFSRVFGPDLGGLFLGDTGAFGVKAAAALRLIQRPSHTAYLSWRLTSVEAMVRCKSRLARLGVASEIFGFDRRYNAAISAAAASIKEGVAAVAAAAAQGGLKGLASAAKIAAAGRSVLDDVPYSLHVILDGHARAVVDANRELVEAICREEGATPLPSTIPAAVRGSPFRPARPGIVNAAGEVFLPVHGLFPPSRATEAALATERVLGEREAALRAAGVTTRFLCAMSGTEVLLEAIFDWRDEIGPFRASLLEPADRDELAKLPPAPAAREIVLAVRRELSDVYDSLGAVHLQIAKYYPYQQLMHGPTRELLQQLKRTVDPDGRMSPGNLGF
jgi:D-lactate dehydrogenase (cytochrome)